MRWPCLLVALLLGGALTSRPAPAAPVYTIAFPGSTVNSGTPFMRDSSFALLPSSGTAEMTTWGYGSPGLAQGRGRIDVTWTTGGASTTKVCVLDPLRPDEVMVQVPGGRKP